MLDGRVPLLQLLRCYDYQRLAVSSASTNASVAEAEERENDRHMEYNMLWGLNEALDLMWANTTQEQGVPLFHKGVGS
jgi:hypothetical protein